MFGDIFFFFFQAEDGIRDYKVTGVQTCALPIYRGRLIQNQRSGGGGEGGGSGVGGHADGRGHGQYGRNAVGERHHGAAGGGFGQRSRDRGHLIRHQRARAGGECGSRGVGRHHYGRRNGQHG